MNIIRDPVKALKLVNLPRASAEKQIPISVSEATKAFGPPSYSDRRDGFTTWIFTDGDNIAEVVYSKRKPKLRVRADPQILDDFADMVYTEATGIMKKLPKWKPTYR